MLVFAALAAGCTHSSESHNADASVTAPAEQPADAPEAPTGPQPATAAEAAAAMDEAERTGSAAPATAGGSAGAIAQADPAGSNGGKSAGQKASGDETACVDAWLKAQKMDRYGSPEGTMYAGGSPLFDECTGERAERLPFVYKRHPAAKKACQADGQPKQQAQ